MKDSIRLSPKHGVNPSVERCFVCGEPKGVVLFGKLKGDAEAPRDVVLDREPCDTCKGWMEQGIILIEVDPERTEDQDNPYRTGRMVVIREAAIRRMVQSPELAEQMCKMRIGFVEIEAFERAGLHNATPDPEPSEP